MTRCACPTHKGNPSPAPAAESRLRALVGELFRLQADDVVARLGRIMRGDPLEKGGSGSGNFGHAGRPGELGGSSDDGGGLPTPNLSIKRGLIRDESSFLETSNLVHSEMVRVLTLFPFLEKKMGGLRGVVIEDSVSSGRAHYNPKDHQIHMRPINEETGATGSLVLGKSIVDDSRAGEFRHELGHYIAERLRVGAGIKDPFFDAWKKEGSSVSARATYNLWEGFAESFSARTHPEYRAGLLPVGIESELERLLGSKSVKSLSLEPATPPLLSPKWDARVVRATMPLLLGVFTEGGNEALRQIRKLPRAAKGMRWIPPSMVEKAAPFVMKASRFLSFDDFMDSYTAEQPLSVAMWIDDPEVLKAAEREAYQFAQAINSTTADALREVIAMGMDNGDNIRTIANSISNLSEEWAEGWRAEMIARTETARAYTVGRIEAWRATGVVKRVVWSAAGDACPFCQQLDGTVVDLGEPFARVGDTLSAEWNGQDIFMDITYADVLGAPLHPNCRCSVVGEVDYEALEQGGETLEEILAGDVSKGGPGSGHFGHEGRPGEVGGSADVPARFHPGPDPEKPGKGGKWTLANGKPLPAHVPRNIPPGYTDVLVSLDPASDILYTARDSKGRTQTKYSESFMDRQKAAKFARVRELLAKKQAILRENEEDVAAGSEEALVTKLIFATGLRPGSAKDTKAEKLAYGATTLLAEHVAKAEGGGVLLHFTGKKGVDLSIPVEDRSIAKVLLERKARGGKLFGTSERLVLSHVGKLDGGGFLTKDIRTAVGTETALAEVRKMAAPASEKEYKRAVHDVAKVVSAKLGNTPAVALQSYIAPEVFSPWRKVWDGERAVAAKSYQVFDLDAEIQFGEVEELPDWRKVKIVDDEDPDDELLETTPEDVVETLGFDPLELLEGEQTTAAKGGPGSGHFGHSGRPGEVGGSDGDSGDHSEWKVHLDSGPEGWEAGRFDVTRIAEGLVDPREAAKIPGKTGEELLFKKSPYGRYEKEGWESLVASIKKEGLNHPPMIVKQKDGSTVIWEGNHRVRAAIAAGLTKIPVEIQYWGNSQRSGLIPIDKGPEELE